MLALLDPFQGKRACAMAGCGALVACSLASCLQFQTFDAPTQPAHSSLYFQEKNNLSISADLLQEPHLSDYHFGPDLRKQGYFPVYVYLENRGSNSFELDRRKFKILLENGTEYEPVPPWEVLASMRRSSFPAFVVAPLVLPGILLYRNIEEYNFRMAEVIHAKAMPRSLRLEPGDPPLARALFFKLPEMTNGASGSLKGAVLQALVEVEGAKMVDPEGGQVGPLSGARSAAAAKTSSAPVVGKVLAFTIALSGEAP